MKSTYHAKAEDQLGTWIHIDADGHVLGRLAVEVARRLMGKHRPTFTPHVDTGDTVVITNAEKIRVTGRKAETKMYRHHTGYLSGLVERPFATMLEKNPTEIIELAVRRMLPKSKLGRKMFSKLKVYAGSDHPHEAQKPETVTL
jgi:large subunit ribosomal protein L13